MTVTEQGLESGVGLFVDTEGRGPSIHTYGGGRFYVLDPQAADVRLEDIAASLSNLCRFNGHTTKFYSVAEHSYLVGRLLLKWTDDPKIALLGLLHDAAEAYMGDVTRPLKVALEERAPGTLGNIEQEILVSILDRFDLPHHAIKGSVWGLAKDADNQVLSAEMRKLLAPSKTQVGVWGFDLPEADSSIHVRGYAPGIAYSYWVDEFAAMWGRMGRDESEL